MVKEALVVKLSMKNEMYASELVSPANFSPIGEVIGTPPPYRRPENFQVSELGKFFKMQVPMVQSFSKLVSRPN